jgi:O-antigen/teichoic acid export membrane protein
MSLIVKFRGVFRNPLFFMSLLPAIGQSVYFLILPLLSRNASPEAFGYLGLFMSFTAPLSIFLTLKYEQAIPIIRRAKYSNLLAIHLIYLSIAICLMLFFVLAFFLKSEYFYFLFLCIIGSFGLAFFQIKLQVSVRRGEFKKISIAKLIQPICRGGGALVLILYFFESNYHLLHGYLAALFISSFFLGRLNFSFEKFKFLSLCYRYIQFPKYSAPSALVDALVSYLPIIIIGYIFGKSEAGLYTMVNMIGAGPIGIITNSISALFIAKCAEKVRDKEDVISIFDDYLKKQLKLSFPLIVCFTLLAFFSAEILGENWGSLGSVLYIMMFMYVLQFIASPLTKVLIVIEKQKVQFYFTLSKLVLLILAILIGFSDFYFFIFILSFLMGIWYIAYIFIARNLTRVYSK